MNPPTAVILYVHNDDGFDNRERVLHLCETLRADGIDATIDQYFADVPPPEGWPNWMRSQIASSQFVLVVSGTALRRRWEKQEEVGKGLGAVWEGDAVTQELYSKGMVNDRFIPIGFKQYGEHLDGTPLILQGTTYIDVSDAKGYEALLRRVHKKPRIKPRPIGSAPAFDSHEAIAVSTKRVSASGDWIMVGHVFCHCSDFRRDRSGDIQVTVAVEPGQPADYLDGLRAYRRNQTIPVAYQNAGWLSLVLAVESASVGKMMEFTLSLRPEDLPGHESGVLEDGNSYSADQIAEIRARLLLLGEVPPRWGRGNSMLEVYVRGVGTAIEASEPVIPSLRAEIADDIEFLMCARLAVIFALVATTTIERVDELTLALSDEKNVEVSFRGTRDKIYSNAPPSNIQLKGLCPLN